MPNPLTRRTNQSEQPPVRVQPQTHVPARVLPYRGIETHGVDITDAPDIDADEADYGTTVAVPIEPPESEPEPVPVRIVQSGRRERRTFRSVVAYANGTNRSNQGSQLLGRDDSRTKATIRNKSVDAELWISHAPEYANPQFGFFLAAGERYDTSSQDAIYGTVANKPDDLPVYIAIESSIVVED